MNNPMFRPPAEADSLILQVDQGCPHNRCTFCGMYRTVPYRRLALDEVARLAEREAGDWPDARRIFLADGDVMSRPFAELQAMLETLCRTFPSVARVGTYANGSSIVAKTPAQLQSLRALKLHTLYMGLESGDETVLKRCRKAETAARMVEAGVMAQEAGFRMSVMVLIGLGGQEGSASHMERTAAALNRMQPRLLSALRVIPIPGTELSEDELSGCFRQLTAWQAAAELRGLIDLLDLRGTVFRANHGSNVVPLEGRLPQDKGRLLAELDGLLGSELLDRDTPGPAPMWL